MNGCTEPGARFDTALFEERCKCGGDGYLELAAVFSTYMDDEMSILSEAVGRSGKVGSQEQATKLAARAHSLAGGAATFGLRGVQEASLQMERTLLQGRAEGIRASFLVLDNECSHAREFLRRVAKRQEPGSPEATCRND